MANVIITVNENDRSELNTILGFSGYQRGEWHHANGQYVVTTAIGFAGDFSRFAETFASHLNPTFKLVAEVQKPVGFKPFKI